MQNEWIIKETLDEIKQLKNEKKALQKKINDLDYFLSCLADECQSKYGHNCPIYKRIIATLIDSTKWLT